MLLRTLHVLESLCPFSMFGPQMHQHHLAILKLITADPILSKERISTRSQSWWAGLCTQGYTEEGQWEDHDATWRWTK